MKRILFVLTALFALSVPSIAHPLGNFSVNQFSRIDVGQDEVKIHQVVDLAEIPTFQESSKIDTDRDGKMSESELARYQEELTASFVGRLFLSSDDQPQQLEVKRQRISLIPGEAGLPTLRMEWELVAGAASGSSVWQLTFRNENYADRIGWREMVANGEGSVKLFDSSVYSNTLSDELRSYPENLLSSPLAETSASFAATTGEVPASSTPLRSRDGKAAAPIATDQLAKLIAVPEITASVALIGLLIAFGLGAVHAMSPGHGKTVVGAYLVGSRGTPKHALFLGLTVTVTHTLGVFALGLVTLFASNYFLPEQMLPFLGFLSGLLVFFIGASMFKERLFNLLGWNRSTGHSHDHDHDHEHDHHHDDDHDAQDGHTHEHNGVTHTHGGSTHTHAVPEAITWRNLLALGISGGLLPCPSALVLMLSAIAIGRVGYGLILTIAFSFGLAATLTVVGLLFLYVRTLFAGSSFANSSVFKLLPVASAFVITIVGATICYGSLS